MKVEDHWSFHKRIYLYKFNSPRVALLIYILGAWGINKYRHDFCAVCAGKMKPVWWYAFVKSADDVKMPPPANTYATDLHEIARSCLAWASSPYFICKNHVQSKFVPAYGCVKLKRSPPFIQLFSQLDEKTKFIGSKGVFHVHPRGILAITLNQAKKKYQSHILGNLRIRRNRGLRARRCWEKSS